LPLSLQGVFRNTDRIVAPSKSLNTPKAIKDLNHEKRDKGPKSGNLLRPAPEHCHRSSTGKRLDA
jgi:hypothetical protein